LAHTQKSCSEKYRSKSTLILINTHRRPEQKDDTCAVFSCILRLYATNKLAVKFMANICDVFFWEQIFGKILKILWIVIGLSEIQFC